MAMKIDSGEQEIELINEARGTSIKVLVAIYDIFFLGRIMEAGEALDGLHSKLQEGNPETNEDFIKYYHEAQDIDKEMRGVIDDIFDAPVCDTLFPRQSMFAIGNGMPTWCNLLTAIVESMDSGLDEEKRKAQARIRKYSSKYKK